MRAVQFSKRGSIIIAALSMIAGLFFISAFVNETSLSKLVPRVSTTDHETLQVNSGRPVAGSCVGT